LGGVDDGPVAHRRREVVDEGVEAVGGVERAVEVVEFLRLAGDLDAGAERRERVLEVVGEHAREAVEALALALELPLAALLVGDVGDEPLEFGVQGTDVDGATPLPDPPGLAIGGDDPVGHLEGLAVGDRLPNGPPDPIALLRVDDVAPREVAGQDPLARIARQRLAVLLQGRHRLVGVVRTAVDRPGEVVDQRPEAVVAVGGVGQVSQDGLADRPPMAGRRGAGDRRPLGIPVGGDVGEFGRRGRLVALQVVSRSAISEWSSGWMNSRASRPTSAAGSLALREVGARAVRVDDGAVLVVAQHRRRGRVDEFAGVALVAPQGGLGAALGDRLGDPVCEDRVRSVPVSFRR